MQQVSQARGQLERGKPDAAILTLEKAVRIDARNGEAFIFLARAWKQKGEKRKALEFAKKAELLYQKQPEKAKGSFLARIGSLSRAGGRRQFGPIGPKGVNSPPQRRRTWRMITADTDKAQQRAGHIKGYRAFLLVVLAVSLYMAYLILFPFIDTLILAIVLASIFNPLQVYLERRLKGRKNLAALIIVLIITFAIAIPGFCFYFHPGGAGT